MIVPLFMLRLKKNDISLSNVGGSGSIFSSKQDFRLGLKPLVCCLSLVQLFPSCVPLEIIFHIILIMFHITFSSWRNFTKSKLA